MRFQKKKTQGRLQKVFDSLFEVGRGLLERLSLNVVYAITLPYWRRGRCFANTLPVQKQTTLCCWCASDQVILSIYFTSEEAT